jgi:hypothetical protein
MRPGTFVQGCLASIIKNLSPKNKTSLIAQAKDVPTILSRIVADDLQLGNAAPLVRSDFQQKGLVTVSVAVWHGV